MHSCRKVAAEAVWRLAPITLEPALAVRLTAASFGSSGSRKNVTVPSNAAVGARLSFFQG